MRTIEGYVLLNPRAKQDVIYGKSNTGDGKGKAHFENIRTNNLTPYPDSASALLSRHVMRKIDMFKDTSLYLRKIELKMIDRKNPSYLSWFYNNEIDEGSDMEYFVGRKDLVILCDTDRGKVWNIYGKRVSGVRGIAHVQTSDYFENRRKPLRWEGKQGNRTKYLLTESIRQSQISDMYLGSLALKVPRTAK